MSLSVKINQKLHGLMTRYVLRAYAKKSNRVEKKHPELISVCPLNHRLSQIRQFA